MPTRWHPPAVFFRSYTQTCRDGAGAVKGGITTELVLVVQVTSQQKVTRAGKTIALHLLVCYYCHEQKPNTGTGGLYRDTISHPSKQVAGRIRLLNKLEEEQ